jgi:beta-lactamase regulating signal transducer with metallopeptidase domain
VEELTLTTPALLFSAISLIMLAYTNRFLGYTAVIRSLSEKYKETQATSLKRQINNLKLRLNLTRYMQIFGITSLLLCVLTMFLIYITQHITAVWVFGIALLLLIFALSLLIMEIQISAKALQHHLGDIEDHLKNK